MTFIYNDFYMCTYRLSQQMFYKSDLYSNLTEVIWMVKSVVFNCIDCIEKHVEE